MIVLLTGVSLFGLLRPEAVTGWLSLMGLILLLIGVCIAVFVDENNRDRAGASAKLVTALPTPPAAAPTGSEVTLTRAIKRRP